MRPTILMIEAVLALLSVFGLRQRRWPSLRGAILLGWLAPFPAYICFMLTTRSGFKLDHSIAGLRGLLVPYFVFAVPMFGPYCFLVGLAGSWAALRLARPSVPGWAQPTAIAGVSMLAALPFVLIEGSVLSGLGLAAVVSSSVAGGVLLLFRRRLFVE